MLKAQQNALHERVAQLEITAARNHAELLSAIAAKPAAEAPAPSASVRGIVGAPPASSSPCRATGQSGGASGGAGSSGDGLAADKNGGQHIVLLKFAGRELRDWAEGLERTARSCLAPHMPEPLYECPDYHNYTLVFNSHVVAAT